jgi:hypothetical protein
MHPRTSPIGTNDNTNLKLPLNFFMLSIAMNNGWYDHIPIPTLSCVYEVLHINLTKVLILIWMAPG